jgi:hypothetical protein
MDITCNRCHETVPVDSLYCPTCGLPQLVYEPDSAPEVLPEGETVAVVRDASAVNWKPALRAALIFAIPAGLLSSGLSPVAIFGLFWMAAAAAWAVSFYVRTQKPAWITIGAGARIGLVTGLMAGWLAFSVSGGALFVERYGFHQSDQIDSEWKNRVALSQQMTQQWTSGMSSSDAAQTQAIKTQVQTFMLSPEGHAAIECFGFAANAIFLIFFAVGGGALGARLLAGHRKPEL